MRYVPHIAALSILLLVGILVLTVNATNPPETHVTTSEKADETTTPEPESARTELTVATSSEPSTETLTEAILVTSTPPTAQPIEAGAVAEPVETTPEPTSAPTESEPVETEEPEPAATQAPAQPRKIAWGVFTGSNMNSLDEFERRVDANPDYLAWFVHWGNHGGELPYYVKDYAYRKDRILILFWEASDYIAGGTDQPEYAYRRILAGDWDAYIEDFKQQLIDYEGDVILIPFSELNGDWTPWSGTENGNTPEEAVLAFRYLHDRMSDAPNISFGWAVNRMSVPNTYENRIERYYPGDAYVDYVGVDGFNKGNPWLTFSEIFHEPLMTLAQYNKPTFVFSFGSAPGSQKAQWLDTAFNIDIPKYSHVVGWVYFNQDKERNWLLWSDPVSFQVFKDYIGD